MSIVCADHRARRPLEPRKPAKLAAAESLLALVRVWRERSRLRRQLAAMSDRELMDIGTCWSEVADEAAKPFWRK